MGENGKASMTLDALEVGACAIIDGVNGSGELRRHLLDMGLTPGVGVRLRKVAPMGDPLQVELRGYELTLRVSDAQQVAIAPVDELPAPSYGAASIAPVVDAGHPGIGEAGAAGDEGVRNVGEPIAKGQPITFALAGNQNCGKTTLFNQLTGANQHVGNFPGVTVDKKEGQLRRHPEATVVDLPGVYSLSPYSNEEVVTRDFLIDDAPTAIINIVDATNIERNLYLTLQLMELNIPMVLALNMMDELRANGGSVRINELEAALGIPVVPISAVKNEGIDELVDHAMHVALNREVPKRVDFCPADTAEGDPLGEVHRCIHALMHVLEPAARKAGLPLRFAATKMVEGDPLIEHSLALPAAENAALNQLVDALEREGGLDREAAMANMRFSFIERLCATTVVRPHESREHKRSVAADRILTGRFTAIPCFILIMAFVFLMTFSWLGAFLSDWLQRGIDVAIAAIGDALAAAEVAPMLCSLVTDGVCGGVGRCYRLSADDCHAVFLPVDFGRLGLHGPRGVRDGQAATPLGPFGTQLRADANGLWLLGSGHYVGAHPLERARPQNDDFARAVHELLGKAADLRLHRGRAVRARRARVGSAVVVPAWHGGGRAVCARVEAVEIPRRARAVRDGAAELSPSEREERGAPCVG